ncbi:Uncharacterised protein [Klebsiella pneumoniae]|nr:Uncharacterised protein [Klebsiella pneumoniae]
MQHVTFVIADTHHHLSFLGKFHRVADQVPQDLAQSRAVRHHFMRQRQGWLHDKAQSLLLRLQTREVFQIGKEAGEIHRLVIKLNFTALHLIHINNIVEDITQRDR